MPQKPIQFPAQLQNAVRVQHKSQNKVPTLPSQTGFRDKFGSTAHLAMILRSMIIGLSNTACYHYPSAQGVALGLATNNLELVRLLQQQPELSPGIALNVYSVEDESFSSVVYVEGVQTATGFVTLIQDGVLRKGFYYEFVESKRVEAQTDSETSEATNA